MYGHHGKILKVDLSNSETQVFEYDTHFARMFMGGNGFAAKLVKDYVPAEVKPFDPENVSVIATGPFTNTPLWGNSRGHIGSVSPLTGYFFDSNFGGDFAAALKRTGFDAVIVTGASDKPVYLKITPKGAQIKSAAKVWGTLTEECNDILAKEEGNGSVGLSIGPAGENLVRFACIIDGGKRSGAAGRGGLGAVWGSKKLKAIVACGDIETPVADKDGLMSFRKKQTPILRQNTKVLTEMGTPFLVNMLNGRGTLCTHNASVETFDEANGISGQTLLEKYIVKRSACYRCPVACGKDVKVPSGRYAGKVVRMPEFENIYAMGSMMDIADIEAVINANATCDMYGMDAISMGVTAAFAAECFEKGLLTEKDYRTAFAFGQSANLEDIFKRTALRQDIGDLLAEGSAKIAEKLGGDAHKYVYGVKGLEIAGHSARGVRPLSLGYATSTRGGSHHDTRPQYPVPDEDHGFEGAADYNIRSQNFTALGDSLVMCRFLHEKGLGSQINDVTAEAVNCITGWDTDKDELNQIGERIYNTERVINNSRGVSRKVDCPPWRTLNEPIPEGPAKGRYCPQEQFDKLLDEYYQKRGWSKDGIVTDEKITELGIDR